VWSGVVVDVGCRGRELERPVAELGGTYFGIDLAATGDVVADLGSGLPLRSASADTVVGLDVLEHTDDIHHAFDEMCRVATRHVVITLPNMYDWRARLRHLRGLPLSGKYGLPIDPPDDRHRWLFGLDEARSFCLVQAQRGGWQVDDERVVVGPRGQLPLANQLATKVPRWFCSTYLALLTPRAA
jgi:hypothetical protein